MKIITYLAFTLLSIVIQFCVMDYIQEKAKLDKPVVDLNLTSPKKDLNDILKGFTQKPYALYYRTNVGKSNLSLMTTIRYSNASIPEISLETSTDLAITTFEMLYDENASVTEDTFTTVTEDFISTTEFYNVTEITLFNTKNNTPIKPNIIPKSKDCNCNLLYKACDINCCCDNDCTDADQKMFTKCLDKALGQERSVDFCYSPFSYNHIVAPNTVESLFCVVKTNLPDKRNINRNKFDASVVDKSFKWHTNTKMKTKKEFVKKKYEYSDPIWILRNGSVYFVDSPATVINSYCTGRSPIKFLVDQTVKCNVKLTDLEIFQIKTTLDDTSLISVTEISLNSSALNCSTVHCTNWSIVICNEATCMSYNKSLHEPTCTESFCTGIALKVDYIFNYFESKIINATVKLYTEKVSLNMPFMMQEINVKFLMGNKSLDQLIKFSGSPGYIHGFPLLVSFNESNHTDYFYNSTSKKYLSYPDNQKGMCVKSNISNNFVVFGANKRIKCRYQERRSISGSDTDNCKKIQNNINELLRPNSKLVLSPFGNPYNVKDEDWILVQVDALELPLYGELNAKKSKLRCYNLVTRISLIFTYVDVGQTVTNENKIVSAKMTLATSNVTFNLDDISTVVTFDTIFMDGTKPSHYEYAGGPHLNIHLPKDFFFPFHSNKSYVYRCNFYVLFVCITAVAFINK